MKASALFARGTTGAALGVAVYVIASSLLAFGFINLVALVMAMLTIGITFGVVSAVVHRLAKVTLCFGSCLGAGFLSVAVVVAGILAMVGTGQLLVNLATAPFEAIFGMAALVFLTSAGGYFGSRVRLPKPLPESTTRF